MRNMTEKTLRYDLTSVGEVLAISRLRAGSRRLKWLYPQFSKMSCLPLVCYFANQWEDSILKTPGMRDALENPVQSTPLSVFINNILLISTMSPRGDALNSKILRRAALWFSATFCTSFYFYLVAYSVGLQRSIWSLNKPRVKLSSLEPFTFWKGKNRRKTYQTSLKRYWI